MRQRPHLALGLALAAALPSAGTAETSRVRSGDHAGYTRLVIELADPAEWRLGRVEGGYAIEVARPDLAFETTQVFRLISRDRIAALEQTPGTGRLTLLLACDCHATAVDFRDNWIVLDVLDGPAPAGSRFEAAMAPAEAADATGVPGTPAEQADAAPAEAGTEAASQAAAAAGGAAAPARDQSAGASTMPRLLPGLGGAGAGIFIQARPAAANAAAAPDPMADAGTGEAGADPTAAASSGIGAAPSATAGTARIGNPAPMPDFAALESEWQRRLAPVSPGAEPGAEAPPFDPAAERIATQEAQLLEELARAAAQGLLEADLPSLDRLRRGQAAASGTAPTALPQPDPPAPGAHVRLEAQTSIDRDAGASTPRRGVTDMGVACLPDAMFDFEAWGGAGDPAEGITQRRRTLVGEFDRPDTDAVLALARYYLFLGFGAEAKSTLAAFQATRPEAEVVVELATILDGERGGLPGQLAGQDACTGRVALWSVLAEGGPQPDAAPNQRAILATFSALPLHLRRNIGPGLAEQFLALGDRETAIALRNAIARAPGAHGDAMLLLDARIALSEGDPDAAVAFEALVGGDDTVAAEAYKTFLETELAAGRVPPQGPQTAAALAFEIAGTEIGADLAILNIQGILAAGDFAAARSEIERLEDEGSPAGPRFWSEFADGLTRGAQDGTFLRLAFGAREQLAQVQLPEPIATALARRLTGLGFPEEALRYLPPAETGEAAVIARADALIDSGAPAEAFGTLAPLRGVAAERLRARALLALGDARGAAQRFAAAGDPVSGDRAAWVAGAWDLLVASEDATLREVAEARQAQAAMAPMNRMESGSGGGSGGLSGPAPDSAVSPGDDPGTEIGKAVADAADLGVGAPSDSEPVAAAAAARDPLVASAAAASGSAAAPGAGAAVPAPVGRVAAARAALEAAQAAREAVQDLLARIPAAPENPT